MLELNSDNPVVDKKLQVAVTFTGMVALCIGEGETSQALLLEPEQARKFARGMMRAADQAEGQEQPPETNEG